MIYTFFLAFHNFIRWAVLVAGLLSVFKNWQGWLGKRAWDKDDKLAKTFFVITMDVQFLFGIVLYFFLSPLTKQAFSNMAEAMKNKELRFFAVEHFILMMAALILVHIGSAKMKRVDNDQDRFKLGSIFFTIAMVLILAAIPWTRRLLPF